MRYILYSSIHCIHTLPSLCRPGAPIALTSANVSGERSPVEIGDFAQLWPLLAAVIDGGLASSSRAGSTVVDLTRPGSFMIVRDGSALEQTSRTLRSVYKLEQRFQ